MAIAGVGDAAPINVLATQAHDTVLVLSMQWFVSTSLLTTFTQSLSDWCGVVLVPATTAAERQRWLASRVPRAQLVVTGHAGTLNAPYRALVAVRHQTIASALTALAGHVHSALVTRVLVAALSLPLEHADVASLARAVHMHQRTLRRKLARAHPSCSAQRLLGWARLLHVAWWLRDPARTVEQVSEALQCSAASNVRRMFRHYANLTPQQVRDQPGEHGIELLIVQMRADLNQGS